MLSALLRPERPAVGECPALSSADSILMSYVTQARHDRAGVILRPIHGRGLDHPLVALGLLCGRRMTTAAPMGSFVYEEEKRAGRAAVPRPVG
jgi:hypothetical protein